jgi:hypothetical protein
VRRPAAAPSVIIDVVTSPLSGIAVEKRRQLAATLGLFAMLFVAVGAVAATGAETALIKAFVMVALLTAVLLALIAWGVLRSVKLEQADHRLDAAIEAAVRSGGGQMCDCGHEHDPDEMHVVDAPAEPTCSHDGTGADCTHSCDTCVLTSLRAAPAATTRRPQPGPRRPSPVPR